MIGKGGREIQGHPQEPVTFPSTPGGCVDVFPGCGTYRRASGCTSLFSVVTRRGQCSCAAEGLQFDFTAVCRRVYILFLAREMLKRQNILFLFCLSPHWPKARPVRWLNLYVFGLGPQCPDVRPCSLVTLFPSSQLSCFLAALLLLDISWAFALNITKPSHTASPHHASPGLALQIVQTSGLRSLSPEAQESS